MPPSTATSSSLTLDTICSSFDAFFILFHDLDRSMLEYVKYVKEKDWDALLKKHVFVGVEKNLFFLLLFHCEFWSVLDLDAL